MEKKLWSNAELVELGVESTKENGCSVNFDGVEAKTGGIIVGCIWTPSRYEETSKYNKICKYYDSMGFTSCFCKLKQENLS